MDILIAHLLSPAVPRLLDEVQIWAKMTRGLDTSRQAHRSKQSGRGQCGAEAERKRTYRVGQQALARVALAHHSDSAVGQDDAVDDGMDDVDAFGRKLAS
jgi:hypothetical protein